MRPDTPAPDPAPEDDDDFSRPSKSALKRQAHALQALGQELAELPAKRLAEVAMPDALRAAIADYLRTKSHEGRRRQLQFVGKQMRFADPAPLREAVDAYKLGSAKDTLALHEAEAWRDRLLADDAALNGWVAAYPHSDLQRLRSLVRAARKDGLAPLGQRNGRAYRELFQFIKPWLNPDDQGPGAADQPDPPPPEDDDEH